MRDAEPAQFPPQRLPRVQPRRSDAWVRIDGQWRRGWVMAWVQLPDGGWLAWARWQVGKPAAAYGWLHFDAEAIRPRDGEVPPEG